MRQHPQSTPCREMTLARAPLASAALRRRARRSPPLHLAVPRSPPLQLAAALHSSALHLQSARGDPLQLPAANLRKGWTFRSNPATIPVASRPYSPDPVASSCFRPPRRDGSGAVAATTCGQEEMEAASFTAAKLRGVLLPRVLPVHRCGASAPLSLTSGE